MTFIKTVLHHAYDSLEFFFSKSFFYIKTSVRMFLKEVIIIVLYFVFFPTTIESIIVYGNARFDPFDTRFILTQPFSVASVENCICECLNNTICFTATYFGINQTCLLFFAQMYQGELRVVPMIMNATVYFLDGKTTIGK